MSKHTLELTHGIIQPNLRFGLDTAQLLQSQLMTGTGRAEAVRSLLWMPQTPMKYLSLCQPDTYPI